MVRIGDAHPGCQIVLVGSSARNTTFHVEST
jgi:hypothetical protein